MLSKKTVPDQKEEEDKDKETDEETDDMGSINDTVETLRKDPHLKT